MEKLYNTKEVSEYLKITQETVRYKINDGSIKASKIGRNLMVKESDLIKFVDDSQIKVKERST